MTKLELARRRKGMTLRQVASVAGCSHALVGFIERGQRPTTKTTGRKLAKAVGLKATEWETLQNPA